MRLRQHILFICCLIMMNCGDDNSTTESDVVTTTNQKTIITEKNISTFNYTDYALSEESTNALAGWEKYQELAIQIAYLKKADLSFFKDDKVVLKKFIDEFKLAIPNLFKTNPIMSRSVILENTLLKLNENLTMDNIDEEVKLKGIKEVLVAFSYLNDRINKKLEFDYYNKIKPE